MLMLSIDAKMLILSIDAIDDPALRADGTEDGADDDDSRTVENTVVKPSFLVLYNSSVSAVKWFAITDISLCWCFTIACHSMFDGKILFMTSDLVSSVSGIFLQLEHVHRPTGGEISKQSSWCHFWHRWHSHICPHAVNWCMHSGMQVIVSVSFFSPSFSNLRDVAYRLQFAG